MSLTREIARNIVSFSNSTFPAAALEKAKLAVFDTVGVLLAGSTHEGASTLRRVIVPTAAAGPALVFGTEQRLNVLDAAMLNGAAAHMLDFDDSNSQLRGHPSVAILPALMAAAEEQGASGNDILRAYVVGFEAAGRIGMGISPYQYTSGWHPTTSVGIFAAVAASAALRGLGEDQITTALGIAAAMSAGIKSNFGSMTKPFGVGHAARNALLAVALASEGFTSSERAFDHPHGYLNVYNHGSENYDVNRIVSGWGDPLCVLDLGIKQKRFPCCYACLPPVDGILDIRKRHSLRPDEIKCVEVSVHPIRFPHINVPDPQSALDAKFSVHYCVAVALIEGVLKIEDFEGQRFNDAEIRRLMSKVTFSTYDSSNLGGAEIRVTTTKGEVIDARVEGALGGSYAHPLPAELVENKFEICAGRALRPEAVAELRSRLSELESVQDIRELSAIAAKGVRAQ
ncbi:MmgE/PrpD family protein [Xanthobacteraceae bacterium Astr-EGSB]|uniref:MmgE/PrpD family protein n=1 Tax=Astrobacterium formosum TaxID=3069710 RepID=UPI0027AF872A|nr:MmgE/PrpD family protein [Xanthobacteraceae bacterium Astr-EGSB]